MNDDQLLFAAALAHPAEDTPRLALADWFDEHDEPDLAAGLRESKEMIVFLGELLRWDATPVHQMRTYSHKTQAFDDLFPTRIAARLLKRYQALFPVPPGARTEYREDAPLDRRSYHDPHNPISFLYEWQHERRRQITAIRGYAAGIAGKRSLDSRVFEPPTNDPKAFEERSCLLNELVLRRRDLSVFPGSLKHADIMRERGHPLTWLPLSLLPPDAELPVPQFNRSGGVSMGTVSGGEVLPIRAIEDDVVPAIIASEPFPPESRLFEAVRSWRNESNGSLEGILFHLNRPLRPDEAGRLWFTRLPAESLNASLIMANWSIHRVTTSHALAMLFGAAHNGGAYSEGERGAYSRLHAWQSLGVMAGCGEEADATTIASTAERCEWFTFAGTNWFANIAWDLGLICLRRDRLTVVLLAATDAD